MDTKRVTQEQISAFADGELDDVQVEALLAALHHEEGRAAWETYHQIGDVLRSDDIAITLSDGFSASVAARLTKEPAILAPAATAVKTVSGQSQTGPQNARASGMKRFGMTGIVAAAAAVFAFTVAPQLMTKSDSSVPAASTVAVSTNSAASVPVASVSSMAASQVAAVAPAPTQDSVVLRDPRMDEYLMAHQRFSPSVYSSAQFARSATFATDSDK